MAKYKGGSGVIRTVPTYKEAKDSFNAIKQRSYLNNLIYLHKEEKFSWYFSSGHLWKETAGFASWYYVAKEGGLENEVSHS